MNSNIIEYTPNLNIPDASEDYVKALKWQRKFHKNILLPDKTLAESLDSNKKYNCAFLVAKGINYIMLKKEDYLQYKSEIFITDMSQYRIRFDLSIFEAVELNNYSINKDIICCIVDFKMAIPFLSESLSKKRIKKKLENKPFPVAIQGSMYDELREMYSNINNLNIL